MKKNILVIIIILIGIVILVTGFILISRNSANDDKQPQKQQETIGKDPNTTENPNNEILKKEHCLDNLCIKDLIIAKQADIYAISGTLENKNNFEINDTAIKLIFTTSEGKIIENVTYLSNVPSNKSIVLEIHFTDNTEQFMNAKEYKIEYASEAEKESIKNTIVN